MSRGREPDGPPHGTYPEPQPPPIVLVGEHPVVRRRVEAAAREMGAILLPFPKPPWPELPAPPRAFVVELALPGAIDAIGPWKASFPGTPVVGVLAVPSAELWTAAEGAGADVVVTHGTVHRRLAAVIAEHAERGPARWLRVAPRSEFEGRLGCVGRLVEGVPEEIALYHVGYEICAVSNTCPHAGARLSEGEVDGAVVTCPRHGSQFDVRTGERLRGPADEPIASYRVVIREGTVFVAVTPEAHPRTTNDPRMRKT